MMKTYNVMLSLVMAMTMTAICPATMWAQSTCSDGHSFDDLHDPDHTVCTRCGHSFIYFTTAQGINDDGTYKGLNVDGLKDMPDFSPYGGEDYQYSDYYTCYHSGNTYFDEEKKMYVSEFFYPLSSLEQGAFRRSNVVRVILPNTVRIIRFGAFIDCKFLDEITLGNSLREIDIRDPKYQNYEYYADLGEQIDPFYNSNEHKKNFRSILKLPFPYWNISIELTDQSYFTVEGGNNNSECTVRHASYKRIMPNKWGTIVLPLGIYQESDDYDIYKYAGYDSENNELKLERITGTGLEGITGTCVLIRMSEKTKNADDGMYHLTISRDIKLYNEDDGKIVSTAINQGETANGLKLTGTYQQKEVESGYIIANNAFWNVESLKANDELWKDASDNTIAAGDRKIYCDPFRGYLAGTPSGATGAPERLGFAAEGDADVSALETLNAITSGEAQYFDLDGRPLSDLQDGVNIVKRGGKSVKVIIR